jgi:hypothetical protein
MRFLLGATVIVDEAGMLATPKLASVAELADRHRWRVVLVGDVRQLPAVGRGGMFTHLCALTQPVELEGIHRFHQPWERAASLRLRAGDPHVLDDYHHHQRLHAGNREQMVSEVLDHWHRHRRDGQSVVMLAPGNDTVDELNWRAQHARIRAGELDPQRTGRGAAGIGLHVGDMVVTRENNRELRTDRGVMIRNRATWTITGIAPGGITVHGTDGTITLPGDYTRRAVELGYAQTIHGAQGRTVDHSLLLADTPLEGRGLYVAMTRGRTSNHVYIAPEQNQDPREVLERAVAADWADRPALDTHIELHRPQPQPRHVDSRLGRLEPLAPRQLVAIWQDRQQLAQLGIDRHQEALHNAERALAVEQHRARSLHHDVARIQHKLVATTGTRAELPRLGHRRQRVALDHHIDQLHGQLNQTRAALQTSVASLPRIEAAVHDERTWFQEHEHVPGRITELDRTLRLDAHARAHQAIAIDPANHDRLGRDRTALELGLSLQLRTISQTMAPVQPPTPQRSRSPRLEGPELGLGL